MPELDEPFRPDEVLAAERLDVAIDDVITGTAPSDDAVVPWLLFALRADTPQSVRQRVAAAAAARARAAWRLVRVVALLMAASMALHGLSSIVNGEWVADNLHEPYGEHAWVEGGLAYLAVAVALGMASLRRRSLPVAVAAGAPLGGALGAQGVMEIGEFAWGAVLHLGEGTLGVLLFLSWWRARRYAPEPPDEEGA